MRQEMACRDPLLARHRELGPVARHGRIQVELPAVDEDEGAERGHRFRRREDVDDRVALPRTRPCRIGVAAPQVYHDVAIDRRGERGADLPSRVEVRREGVADRSEPRGKVAVDQRRGGHGGRVAEAAAPVQGLVDPGAGRSGRAELYCSTSVLSVPSRGMPG